MTAPKPGPGGARPGAGRPPSGRQRYDVRLDPALVAMLDEYARTLDTYVSRSELIEHAIHVWLGRRR